MKPTTAIPAARQDQDTAAGTEALDGLIAELARYGVRRELLAAVRAAAAAEDFALRAAYERGREDGAAIMSRLRVTPRGSHLHAVRN